MRQKLSQPHGSRMKRYSACRQATESFSCAHSQEKKPG